jgi:hypothetical protein
MALEDSAGLGVFAQYGRRTTEGKFGAEIGDEVLKTVVYDIDYSDLASTSAGGVTGLDYVFPIGTTFVSCQYVVQEAIVGPTAITGGAYLASDGTTALDADGLRTAAVGVVTALDAIGDRVIGTGALLATGTGAAFAVTAPVVLRFLPTVAVATAGKMRVYVTAWCPQP